MKTTHKLGDVLLFYYFHNSVISTILMQSLSIKARIIYQSLKYQCSKPHTDWILGSDSRSENVTISLIFPIPAIQKSAPSQGLHSRGDKERHELNTSVILGGFVI